MNMTTAAKFVGDITKQHPVHYAQVSFIRTMCMKRTTSSLLKKLCRTDDSTCPICLEDYDVNEMLNSLPCGHTYHGQCIVKWLVRRNSCPYCRCKLYTDLQPIWIPRPRRPSRRWMRRLIRNIRQPRN